MHPKAKKSLGQNFLMHQQTAERIADVADIVGKTVLEVGPGTGMLTRALLARAERVIAVEADDELIPHLEETFHYEIQAGKLQLVHADIRTYNPERIGVPYVLVANIPYYLTGELFRKFLTASFKPSSLTFLVQKEVAERIARTKKHSLLSLSVYAYGVPHYRFTVPRGAFIPAPNVDSAVLSITDIQQHAFASPKEEERFFEIAHAGFAHKRKQLAKNLAHIAPAKTLMEAFKEAGIPEKVRAEDLSLTEWKTLTKMLT